MISFKGQSTDLYTKEDHARFKNQNQTLADGKSVASMSSHDDLQSELTESKLETVEGSKERIKTKANLDWLAVQT